MTSSSTILSEEIKEFINKTIKTDKSAILNFGFSIMYRHIDISGTIISEDGDSWLQSNMYRAIYDHIYNQKYVIKQTSKANASTKNDTVVRLIKRSITLPYLESKRELLALANDNKVSDDDEEKAGGEDTEDNNDDDVQEEDDRIKIREEAQARKQEEANDLKDTDYSQESG